MKILCISDTHLQEIDYSKYNFDIIVHAGDLLSSGYPDELKYVEFPDVPVIYTPGNHDRIFQDKNSWNDHYIPKNVVMLIDKYYTYNGITFYGTPWSHPFCRWAFMAEDAQITEYTANYKGCDILISHSPPYGIRDSVFSRKDKNRNKQFLGSKRILEMSYTAQFSVFGHIHDSYGITVEGDTTYINASICTEDYEPINKPYIIEIN